MTLKELNNKKEEIVKEYISKIKEEATNKANDIIKNNNLADNEKILNDLIRINTGILINKYLEDELKNNPNIIIDTPLEVEYNIDGSKKDIYTLSKERDIKEMQYTMKINEFDYKLNEKLISKEEYDNEVSKINVELNDLKEIYNNLIFNIINQKDISFITSSIMSYNIDKIDLKRLSDAVIAVSDNKVNEFINNNKEMKENTFSYWNYKYNELSKSISKSREVESFILNLIN